MRTLLLLILLATPAGAVQPDEMLDDPALEARARDLSQGLRCLVCRNESIDESNADLARDMRLLVRERLAAGESDAEIVEGLVDRYGEFVLLEPQRNGANLILWGAPLLLLLAGAGVAAAHIMRQSKAVPDGLDPAEEAQLRELLDETRPR
ncbi:cytochrome c-type biogenesis protein [uncultured Jannaschia sp.]|uniref:cytochrome c-type biogenesis protein n=1 Tax=uncultured Jannaschia sp. TaxID=293347 RepID=UPI0026189AAD|nr:cytochrome c-type biogenesis protein [uncultured Jannaschia sp.]